MWVAQITEPATQGEEEHHLMYLMDRFPQYRFSMMMAKQPYIICKPVDETIMMPGDEGNELEILRYMVTTLIDDAITGHVITDGL